MRKEKLMPDLYDLSELNRTFAELREAIEKMEGSIKNLDVESVPGFDDSIEVIVLRRALMKNVFNGRTTINRAARDFSLAVSDLERWAKSLG
jgi:hypothetical protein